MRVFLVLLILANLGYLAWQQEWLYDRPDPVPAGTQAAFQPAAQSLTLLNELPQQRLDLMDSLAQSRTARTDAAERLEQLRGDIATVAGEIAENQVQLAQDQARSAEVQQALLETLDAAVAEAEVESAPPPEAEAESAPPPEAVAPPSPTLPWCAQAGVFADRPAAQSFVSGLEALGGSGQIEAREEPVSSTWWVHMPAFSSEAVALERLQELQGKGIDSYYMRSGEMAGGISLGVYARQEGALIAHQQLADQGYATSIREVFRMGERLYVRVALPDAALREAPEWTDFLGKAAGIEVRENACETIAP
jgi:cell division protein FtsN